MTVILALLTAYLATGAVYLLFFAVAGHRTERGTVRGDRSNRTDATTVPMDRTPRTGESMPGETRSGRIPRRYLVLLPAYREDAVIVAAARAALDQTIDPARRSVVVIADTLETETMTTLRTMGAHVIPHAAAERTKAKALKAGLAAMKDDRHDVVVILDADNRPAPDFLEVLDDRFERGARVVQGQRVAANTDTPYARLDAISEGVNNHIFRRGHARVGLSAALIGSGMAFEYDLFSELVEASTAIGGFDKEFELALLRRRIRIDWVERARVLDEKVRSADVFRRQRTRWLAAQFHYLSAGLRNASSAVRTRNADYLDKVFQQALPPRILLLAGLPVVAAVCQLFSASDVAAVAGLAWVASVIAIGLSIPTDYRSLITPALLARIPSAAIGMIAALARTRRANRSFIHTPHGPAAA